MEATKVISVLEYAEIKGVFLNRLYLCYNNMVQLENDHKLFSNGCAFVPIITASTENLMLL